MRFKGRGSQKPPEINLIPLIDVLMTVLMFFVVLTMILGEERRVALTLAQSEPKATAPDPTVKPTIKPLPFVVQLDDRGDLLVNGKTMVESQMMRAVETYLGDDPKGIILLNPHPELAYDRVIQTLTKIQELAGDRVSLALGAD
jgi:biopolymer transport protein ExbD